MILNEEYDAALQRKTGGRKLTAVSQAMVDNHVKAQEQRHRIWDACFGLYCFTIGSLNAVLEDAFVELRNKLVPTQGIIDKAKAIMPKKSNQNKTQYEKAISRALRQGIQNEGGETVISAYPYYCNELNQAVKNFDDEAFEKWLHKHVTSESGIIEETVDQASKMMHYDLVMLQSSVFNEMGRIPLPDLDIKSKVYTLYLVSHLLNELHLAWMLVGPVPSYISLNRSGRLDIFDRAKKLAEDKKAVSPYYDHNWHHVMNDGFAYWNVRYAEQMNRVVVGKWTHKIGGTVDLAIEAIRRHITATKYLEKLGNNVITNTEDYSREVKQLEQIDMYRTGEIPMTILHFECARMMNEGKTNEEIEDWLRHDERINITAEKTTQLLCTVEILRGMESGNINPEYFNKGMAEAEARKNDDEPDIDYSQLDFKGVEDMGRAITEGLKEKQKAEEEQQRIQEDPLLRLSRKFNVKAMKERTPKQNHVTNAGKKVERVAGVSKTIDHIDIPDEKVAEAKVEEKVSQLELTPQPPTKRIVKTRWTPDEENYLQRSWGKVSMEDMQKRLWRTEASIRCKATRMISKKIIQAPTPDLFK